MLRLDPASVTDVTAILIGRVGDLIMGGPMLQAIRGRFPNASMRLVVGPLSREVAPLIPGIDQILVFEKFGKVLSHLHLARTLMRGPSDLVVDLNPAFSKSSAALAAMTRAKVKLSFSKRRWDWVFTDHTAPAGEREHMLDRYARLAKELGARYEPSLELMLRPEDEVVGERVLQRLPRAHGLRRVLIHPGNFKKFDNRWPEDGFVQLANRLTDLPDTKVFFLSGPGEERQVEAIASRLKRHAPVLGPYPLGVTGAVMRGMDLVVCNVTGTTHLAAALGVPTFAFYSGYTHAVWRPRGGLHWGVVSRSWTSCRDAKVDDAWALLLEALAKLGPARAA